MTAFSFAIVKTGSDEQNRLCIFFQGDTYERTINKKRAQLDPV